MKSFRSSGPESRAAALCGAVLAIVYCATMAPGITLWDAGEFAAAARTLGVPHPPGTPLYVIAARAWSLAIPAETAWATNLLSALCTAAACAMMASLIARWMNSVVSGVAAGLAAGGVSAIWQSATETEVYAAALLLSVSMMLVAERASARRDARSFLLLLYLMALAIPLHMSALVAAPAAVAMAAMPRAEHGWSWQWIVRGAGVFILAIGVGGASAPLVAVGACLLVLSAARALRRSLPLDGAAWSEVAGALAVVIIATSALAFLVVRARHDPGINQGNPSTISAALDVIARRQYAVAPLWPRRAPLWLQIGNIVQYADWQIALGLDRAVGASWLRTPITILFALLGVAGSLAHRACDRRSWRGMLLLLLFATLGVCAMLNLRAGPSFGHGILPADADREPRERDYFFALGFACWAAWAGAGAVAMGRRALGMRAGTIAGLAVAALPILLNWRVADRRRGPDAALAMAFAEATLRSAPPSAVLFVSGDNDTYPLWYAQTARGIRPDVTTITIPLIGARWYRAELARRWQLYDMADTARWNGEAEEMRRIAEWSVVRGRPVAATVAVMAGERAWMGGSWILRGLTYARDAAPDSTSAPRIDLAEARSGAELVRRLAPDDAPSAEYGEPAARYVASLLGCPALAVRVASARDSAAAELLDSRCNFR